MRLSSAKIFDRIYRINWIKEKRQEHRFFYALQELMHHLNVISNLTMILKLV